MKRILCYGDSNTWGLDATGEAPARFDENTRWTARLQKALGEEYRVLEAGLNGRTTVFEDFSSIGRSGIDYLPVTFETCDPLDLVVVMLGTNDVRDQYIHYTQFLERCMERFIISLKELIAKSFHPACEVLVIAPPKAIPNSNNPMGYTKEWAERIAELPDRYEGLCKRLGVHFANAYDWADPDPADGLHLGVEGHAAFAVEIEKVIRSILE